MDPELISKTMNRLIRDVPQPQFIHYYYKSFFSHVPAPSPPLSTSLSIPSVRQEKNTSLGLAWEIFHTLNTINIGTIRTGNERLPGRTFSPEDDKFPFFVSEISINYRNRTKKSELKIFRTKTCNPMFSD